VHPDGKRLGQGRRCRVEARRHGKEMPLFGNQVVRESTVSGETEKIQLAAELGASTSARITLATGARRFDNDPIALTHARAARPDSGYHGARFMPGAYRRRRGVTAKPMKIRAADSAV
jgi:hypothetical protein